MFHTSRRKLCYPSACIEPEHHRELEHTTNNHSKKEIDYLLLREFGYGDLLREIYHAVIAAEEIVILYEDET